MEEAKNKFQPNGLATVIGSFPHRDAEAACDLVFKYLPEAPAWPQLPRRDFKENMCVQYSPGMPALVLDPDEERIFFQVDESLLGQLEGFYRRVIEDDLEFFGLADDYAAGFGVFLDYLKGGKTFAYLKGCVTGPITFGLTITDQNRKPSLYHPELADAVTKTLTMRARWQARRLNPFCRRVIIFIDEPYLSSIGSAVVSLREKDVVEKLNEVIEGIHREGAIAGIHCCANTDWAMLMKTNVDIISFDAYGYAKNLLLYGLQLRQFLDRGGALAWGIAPSSQEVSGEDAASLLAKLNLFWDKLEKEGFTRRELRENCLITPSCGMGTLTEELSETILKINLEISEKVRQGD